MLLLLVTFQHSAMADLLFHRPISVELNVIHIQSVRPTSVHLTHVT